MTENVAPPPDPAADAPDRVADAPESTVEVTVFRTAVDADEAASRLAASADEMVRASTERRLYYPYHVVAYRVEVDALFNSFDEVIRCGVDLRNDKALLVDGLETTEVSVPADGVLPAEHAAEEVRRTARSYVTEVAHRRLTIGRSMSLTRLEDSRRYRPFHLVECETADGDELAYIVDGVSGDFHRVYR